MAERIILSGWSISGITFVQNGTPAVLNYSSADTLGLGRALWLRPDLIARSPTRTSGSPGFNTASFANPIAPWVNSANGGNQGFGSAGKDAIGPGLYNWNLAVFKMIPITEGTAFQRRFGSFAHSNPRTISKPRYRH